MTLGKRILNKLRVAQMAMERLNVGCKKKGQKTIGNLSQRRRFKNFLERMVALMWSWADYTYNMELKMDGDK